MRELNNKTLICIDGGINLTGSIVSAFTKAFDSILNLGRNLGSAIRRINDNNICSVK